ncbi:MAG: hypothetical protein IJ099_01905 [Alphaproteobacteria bacterium]|nr:hypothetical protein [Alphaproteobacteria bacterium]
MKMANVLKNVRCVDRARRRFFAASLMRKFYVFLVFAVCCLNMSVVWAEETEQEVYNGSYKGKQIIPVSLANFCKIADDAVATNKAGIVECLDKLAAKIHDAETAVQEEGRDKYRKIMVEQWVKVKSEAAIKSANAKNYSDEYYTLTDAVLAPGADIKTRQTGMAAATEKQMTALLDLTDILSEEVKAVALGQLSSINPATTSILPASGDVKKVDFSGAVKDFQMVPNSLAIYCQMNGEDFAKKEKQADVKKCLDTIITKINAQSDDERKDNVADYEFITKGQMQDMFMQAVERSAGLIDRNEQRLKQDESGAKTQTEYDSTTSIASASNLKLSAFNDFLHLFAVEAKYMALKNLANVDARAISAELKEDEPAKEAQDMEVKTSTETVSVTVTAGEEEEVDVDEQENAQDAKEKTEYDADLPDSGKSEKIDESLLDNTGEMLPTINSGSK